MLLGCVLSFVVSGGGPDIVLTTHSGRPVLVYLSTVYEEQLETKFSRETENVFTLSPYYDVDGIGATPPPFL